MSAATNEASKVCHSGSFQTHEPSPTFSRLSASVDAAFKRKPLKKINKQTKHKEIKRKKKKKKEASVSQSLSHSDEGRLTWG